MASNTKAQSQPAQEHGARVFALDTQHEENINDCQFDYYGTQMVSCDSNGYLQMTTLKSSGQQEHTQTF